VPIGIYQAVRRNRLFDYVATTLAFICYAAPTFFLGLILVQLFAQDLNVLPPEAPQSDGVLPIFADFRAMVLPVVTLALLGIAGFTRYMRSAVLDNLTQDYVRTARSKGCSSGRVLSRHVLRNSLLPVTTIAGLQAGNLLGGTVIVEVIFAWPGLSTLMFRGIETRDFPVVQGCVLVISTLFILVTLVVDVLNGAIDPRVAEGVEA
jgi:peptide/nickel transport system permease protein